MNFFNNAKKESNSLLFTMPLDSRYAESFRTLRTNLNFSSIEKDLNSVLVTSSVEGEGKTNTAINLGYAIAQSGKNVLLIDADLRRPKMTEILGLKKKEGFTDIISKAFSERFSKGDLKDYSIGDLLQLLKLQKRTGQLNLDSNENQVAVFLVDGNVVDIYWKNRPESRKLANALIQKNILTKEEATLALRHQKKSIQRLGTILFSLGFVSKDKLTRELAVHTVEVMRLISGMTEGSFSFTTLSRNAMKTASFQSINFDELFKEFLGQVEELLFIKKSVASVVYRTKTENLFVLPSGNVLHNPSEFIGSKGTEFLLELLKKKFDFIIIDTPPVIPATDALLMAPKTDGTILVVKSGNTEKQIVKKVVSSFNNANLPILGIILNMVDFKKDGYYRHYKKHYSSYYGE